MGFLRSRRLVTSTLQITVTMVLTLMLALMLVLVLAVQQDASASPGVGPAAIVARLADFAFFAVLVGIVVLLGAGFHALTAGAALTMATATRRLLGIGAVLMVVGSVASFGLHAAAVVAGSLGDAMSLDAWRTAAGTRTGTALLLRTFLAVMLSILLVRLVDRRAAWWRALAITGAVGLLFTVPAAGHASAATPPALWLFVDAIHVASIALWLGGPVLFAAGGRAWLRSDEVVPTVRRYSAMSLVLVAVIVATGALQTVELAGGIDTLTDTDWGRRLLVKVSLVILLVAVAAVSRWVLHHVGASGIRRTVVLEAVIGVVVLAVTASMVATPPRLVAEARAFDVTLAQAGLIADITVTPGRVGSNDIHLVLTPPGGSLRPVVSVTARMALPERDLPAQPVTITADGPNHYIGVITLAYSGDWDLDVVVELTPGNTMLLSTVVPIP